MLDGLTPHQALQIAVKHRQAGELPEAERICRLVLKRHPENTDAIHFLGTIALQVGKPQAALELVQKAVRLDSSNAHYLGTMGDVLCTLQRPLDAERCYRGAIALKPDLDAAHLRLARLLQRLGRFAEAIASYRRVSPQAAAHDPELHNDVGNALKALGKLAEAQHAYIEALRLNPRHAYAHNNLGATYLDEGRLQDAEARFRHALSLNASLEEPHFNLGNLLRALGKPAEAVHGYRRAIALNPRRAESHYLLGLVLQALGRADEAERSFRQALALRPDYLEAHCLWVHQRQHLCDWSTLAQDVDLIRNRVRNDAPKIFPFTFLALPESSPAEQLRCAQRFAMAEYGKVLASPAISDRNTHGEDKKLRIGYLSADFHDHATSYLLPEVIEQHDRDRFGIYGYSYGPSDASAIGSRVRGAFDVLRDVKGLSDQAAVGQIVSDRIDILVDLKGYTANARVELCALRPAPVQVSWLGYPGTLGHPRLADYLIGDPVVTPLHHAEMFSETLALMPHCYQPNDRKRVTGASVTRASVGLPDSAFVFCCFNRSYKFTPPVLDIWCRLLREVQASILWLLQPLPSAAQNVLKEITDRGIDARRVIFAPKLAPPDHLARLRLADLALDTYPVTSHTTASDALWARVPLVTLIGESFVSRVAASILHAGGLPELVTRDTDSYFALALKLATAPRRLAALRKRLAANRMTCPLFDSLQFTRNLESLYERMWTDHSSGRRQHIVLPKLDAPRSKRSSRISRSGKPATRNITSGPRRKRSGRPA